VGSLRSKSGFGWEEKILWYLEDISCSRYSKVVKSEPLETTLT